VDSIARTGASAPFFSRERTVAGPGFNRWLVPPAALAIHLCIGMVYGESVFWLPLSQAVGITKPVACPAGAGLAQALTATGCDWKVTQLSWIFTLGIVFLGAAAAIWGGWLERAGPRRAGLIAALCWPGGLALMALGVHLHLLWLMWLGGGVIGGVGLGLGYISPVSTLIKWFPDRRGMATGLAIMGFGGGAMIGAPLANKLIAHFATPTDVGVAPALLVLAAVYFVFMVGGALGYRVPAEGWAPAGWVPPDQAHQGMQRTQGSVSLNDATRTPQFWLLWGVLCLNVSAGIGVLDMASPMLQEIFGGRLIGHPEHGFTQLSPAELKDVKAIAAGFAGFLSLFNILGRFFWASMSDRLGRKLTYAIFFLLGMALYASTPSLAHAGSLAGFALAFGVILSMYGGGFATIPAYLADIFGTAFVGAIHGRLLTAWSVAGVVGPVLVTYLREAQIAAGTPRALVYDHTMYILAALLLGGLVCNLLVRPLPERWFTVGEKPVAPRVAGTGREGSLGGVALLGWVAVGLPLAWGFWQTITKASALFR
jgi:MFS family permease